MTVSIVEPNRRRRRLPHKLHMGFLHSLSKAYLDGSNSTLPVWRSYKPPTTFTPRRLHVGATMGCKFFNFSTPIVTFSRVAFA